jgi:glycosyltransferase involved in cell wall biosynthesis
MSELCSSPISASNPTCQKLRIAVFSRTFSPTGGGAERYSMALVEQLSTRHEIHVFAQEICHHLPGVIYHRVSAPLPKPRWINQLWFATATWWATRRGFDVVHSHENTWHGNVQTVHVLPVKYTLLHGQKGWHRAFRWIKIASSPRLLTYLALERVRYALRPGRQIVVTSDSLQATMKSCYPASSKMLSIVTPGITMPLVPVSSQRKSEARRRLGLSASAPILLFVANDYRKKGLRTLLDTLAQLPADVALAIVGNCAQISMFNDQINILKLRKRLFFLGHLKDVGTAYEAADCLVHPTLEDTFGMVVLEAMSYGLPVVVSGSKYCGISALLQHGSNAMILGNPKNVSDLHYTLEQVFSQLVLRNSLIQGGLAFASQYQWREIAFHQEALYFLAIAAKKL